jgi:hypothetical protein
LQKQKAKFNMNRLNAIRARLANKSGRRPARSISCIAKVERMGLEMGDTDTNYLAYYRRALLEGHAGARTLTYLGQFSTEIWEG